MTLNEYVNSIKDKRIAVIGIGVSNKPLIELLAKNGCDVTACDMRTEDKLGEDIGTLRALGVKLRLGEDYLEGLNEDIIFRTPGLMPFEEHLESAKNRGAVITSEMEVFMALCPCRIIAVTGSDGKTTTSTIISRLLEGAGYRVHLGGNIGNPLLCETPDILSDDICVLELSSFQLHSMYCHPDVAVITNLSPNHLDKHKDFQDYMDAKRAICENQSSGARLVLNLEDEHSDYYASHTHSNVVWYSGGSHVPEGTELFDGTVYRVKNGERRKIMDTGDILLPGEHNVLNYMAAFTATEGLVPDDVCRKVAMSFEGVEHRLERVRELRGVTYINDSIGTSPTRTAAGLRAMRTKPIVIVGGYDKHIPFDGLGDDLCSMAKAVILTGATSGKIYNAIVNSPLFLDSCLPVVEVDDFKDAVIAASGFAGKGDIVLLSPACAAFDKFRNFAERGRKFKEIVMELT